jgi:hypothetical protein
MVEVDYNAGDMQVRYKFSNILENNRTDDRVFLICMNLPYIEED